MQCKDIDTGVMLGIIHGHNMCNNQSMAMSRGDYRGRDASVDMTYPKSGVGSVIVWDFYTLLPTIPDYLIDKKLSNMLRKGLLEGCDCGCRGDYQLTEKGLERLRELCVRR